MPSRNCKTRPIAWRIACNEQLAEAVKRSGWEASWVFTNIIASVDNAGRMEGGMYQLRDMFFPHHPSVSPEDVNSLIVTLKECGLVIHYTIKGMWYLQLPKVGRYSAIKGNMSTDSDFPPPTDDMVKEWETTFKDKYAPIQITVTKMRQDDEDEGYTHVVDVWNQTKLPKCMALNETRRTKLRARWKSEHFRNNYQRAVEMLGQSDFALGKNDRKWKASIDWFIDNDNNYVKTLEGKYGGRKSKLEEKYGV